MASWNEDLHPRVPRGQAGGGQWAPKGSGGGWELDDDDRAEIAGYKDDNYALHSIVPKLSQAEKEALIQYTEPAAFGRAGQTGSFRVNAKMRFGQALDPEEQKMVDGLNSIAARTTLPEDTILHRTIGIFSADVRPAGSDIFNDLKPGDVLVDQAFMSTSTFKLGASLQQAGGEWVNRPEMVILAPKGSNVIMFGNPEIILPPPSRLEYMGDDADGAKYFRLDQTQVEHVKPETAGASSVAMVKKQLVPDFVKAAQEEYDAWAQDAEGLDPELGAGGICDRVAEQMGGILASAGIEQVTAGDPGDHAWIVANLEDGVYMIDIPPSVYETGGGYSWKKRPDVTITADDVIIDKIDEPMTDAEFNAKYGDDVQHLKTKQTDKVTVENLVPVGEDEGSKVLGNVGFKVMTVEEFGKKAPEAIRELKMKPPKGISRLHALEAKGFAEAIKMFKGTVLEKLSEIIPQVNILYADYEPKEAGMTTVTGAGQAAFLINTAQDVAERFSRVGKPLPKGVGLSYPTGQAEDSYKKDHDLEKAVALEGKLAAIHEFAHLADAASGKMLTDTFVDTVMLETLGSGEPPNKAVPKWLSKNISSYASSSPQDGMAEAVAKYFHEGKLPGLLNNWANAVLKGESSGRRRH